MKAYATVRGGGKTSFLLSKAMTAVIEEPLKQVVVVVPSYYQSEFIKDYCRKTFGKALADKVVFTYFDSFFCRGNRYDKPAVIFVDDIEHCLVNRIGSGDRLEMITYTKEEN